MKNYTSSIQVSISIQVITVSILQRTVTTAQILLRGAKTVGCNQLIDSGMPPFYGPLS
jgi:hypothetical protein